MDFSTLWNKVSYALSWLFRETGMQFGEIELLHGDHEVLLPMENYCPCGRPPREVWTSVSPRGCVPVCGNTDGMDYAVATVDECERAIRLKIHVASEKAMIKWFVVS